MYVFNGILSYYFYTFYSHPNYCSTPYILCVSMHHPADNDRGRQLIMPNL